MAGFKFMVFCGLPLLFMVSCRKDTPPQKPAEHVTGGSSGFVYIVNEGNFMAANASISRLNLTDGSIVSDYYKTQNNNTGIGDVAQSMVKHNNYFYIVVNNSGKIQVVNASTFQNSGSITGLISPRYMLPVSNNKAFVSDLYADEVAVCDLATNTKVGAVHINGWTEEMAYSYGKVFVTNKQSSYLYVIDAQSNLLTDSINVGYGSTSVAEDKNSKLWVLCSGDVTQSLNAKLVRINPATFAIDTSFTFSSSSNSPFKMRMNGARDEIYFIDYNGVYRMNIGSSLPQNTFIAMAGGSFYGLGIDPLDGTVYVADALDYNQNGKIYRYSTAGNFIDEFSAGVIPGEIFFDK